MKIKYKITDKENNKIDTIILIVKNINNNGSYVSFREQKNRAVLLGEYGPIVITHINNNVMYGKKLDTWSGNLSYGNYDLSEEINYQEI